MKQVSQVMNINSILGWLTFSLAAVPLATVRLWPFSKEHPALIG